MIAEPLLVFAAAACTARAAPGVEIVGVSRQSNTPSRSLTLKRAEHQNVGADAGRAQRRAFLDVGARQQIGAGVFERARHLARAVSVGVRLDDGDDAGGGRRRFSVR